MTKILNLLVKLIKRRRKAIKMHVKGRLKIVERSKIGLSQKRTINPIFVVTKFLMNILLSMAFLFVIDFIPKVTVSKIAITKQLTSTVPT